MRRKREGYWFEVGYGWNGEEVWRMRVVGEIGRVFLKLENSIYIPLGWK